MKLCAMGLDDNDRSITTELEIPMKQVSETGMDFRKNRMPCIGESPRASRKSLSPADLMKCTSPTVRGLCGPCRAMRKSPSNPAETCRLAPGDGIYVDGRALHHSTFSQQPGAGDLRLT